jgi:outer membrane cobalamin receptor
MDVTKQHADYPGDPTQGKTLIYTPRQTVNIVAMIELAPVSVFVENGWTSFRYATEINDKIMEAYSTTSLAARYRYQAGIVGLALKIEVMNLFNTSYAVIAGYPMPLREFKGTLEVEL